MTTVAEFKAGAELPKPIYKHKPYVFLGSRGDSLGVVMDADTLEGITDTVSRSTYYDECKIDIRRYDLHMNDNTRIEEGATK